MKNYCNRNIPDIHHTKISRLMGHFGVLIFMGLLVWSFGVLAAPRDTLPPGFHSKPLAQPVDEPDPDETVPPDGDVRDDSSETSSDGAPSTAPDKDEKDEKDEAAAFLPLLDKNLLLPPKTGLLYGKESLGEKIWQDGKSETIIALLAQWRVKLRSRPVADLARRLLLTHASAPSDIDPFEFMKIRLDKLYRLGDVSSLGKFFVNFPVLSLDKSFTLLHERKAFAQGLRDGRAVSEGCALWEANRRRPRQDGDVLIPPEPIEQQIAALCLGFSGQTGRALSEAENLSDTGRAPREFFSLLTTALESKTRAAKEDIPARSSTPQEINAVLWSLYKLVKRQPRYIYMDRVAPVILPYMARDDELAYSWRLAAAQRAMLHGLLPPRFLQSFYRTPAPQKFARPPPRSTELIRSQNADRAQVRKISNILATAPNRTAYIAFLHSWARDIAFLNLRSGYRRLDGLRASLLLNNRARMKVWLGSVGEAGLPVPMRSILAVLDGARSASHRGIAPQAIERWQQRTDMIAKVIGREFFNLDADDLPDMDETKEGDALAEATSKKRRAEIILRVLVGMDNVVLARSPSFLRAVIRGLSAVGLKEDAWRIAVDAFLIEAWGP